MDIWFVGMFVTLGKGWWGFGPKGPAGLTPKVANIIPGSQIALEGMPPTGGLLAGIVCLSPALVHSLRVATVAHVVRNKEDEGLNIYSDWILYSISLPRPAVFCLSLQKIVEATLWAQMGLRKSPFGFMVKQTCFLEWLLTYRALPYFFLCWKSPTGIKYLITYFGPWLYPYQICLEHFKILSFQFIIHIPHHDLLTL